MSAKCEETGGTQMAVLLTLRGLHLIKEAVFPDEKVNGVRSYYFQIFFEKISDRESVCGNMTGSP